MYTMLVILLFCAFRFSVWMVRYVRDYDRSNLTQFGAVNVVVRAIAC